MSPACLPACLPSNQSTSSLPHSTFVHIAPLILSFRSALATITILSAAKAWRSHTIHAEVAFIYPPARPPIHSLVANPPSEVEAATMTTVAATSAAVKFAARALYRSGAVVLRSPPPTTTTTTTTTASTTTTSSAAVSSPRSHHYHRQQQKQPTRKQIGSGCTEGGRRRQTYVLSAQILEVDLLISHPSSLQPVSILFFVFFHVRAACIRLFVKMSMGEWMDGWMVWSVVEGSYQCTRLSTHSLTHSHTHTHIYTSIYTL